MPNIEFVNPARYAVDTTHSVKGSDKHWADKSIEKYLQAKHLHETKLKKYAREGIPDSMRGIIWPRILRVDRLDEYEKNYEMALQRTFGSHVPQDPIPPTFGGRLYRNKLALTPEGQRLCENILCILLHDFPNLEYCPFLPPLCTLICHHALTADDALGMMVSLVKSSCGRDKGFAHDGKSHEDGDKWTHFPVVRKDYTYMTRAFYHLLERNNYKIFKYLTDLQSTDPEPLWLRWLTDIFLDVLPLPAIFRILDSYFIEGYKTSFRFAYAVLKFHQDQILKCQDADSIVALCSAAKLTSPSSPAILDSHHKQPTFSELSKIAYNLTVKHPDVSRITPGTTQFNSVSPMVTSTDEMVEPQYRYQRMNPKLKQASTVLTEEMWTALWSWIPPKLRATELELIFSTTKDGYHLMNLYERIRGVSPTIMLIETLDKAVFGAYIPKAWPLAEDQMGNFSGTGETILFTLYPYAKAYYWVGMMTPPVEPGKEDELATWEAEVRDKASFFVRATKRDIAIGGGGQDLGLYINETLTSGTSGSCATFENQPLPGKGVTKFEIKTIEIFALCQ